MRITSPLLALCVAAAVALTAGASRAGTVTWANAVNGNWSDDAKWSPAPPAAGDDVVINLPGTYTVTFDEDANLNSLSLGTSSGAQTLQTTGTRTLTLGGPNPSNVNAGGALVLNGPAVLTGAGNVGVAGLFKWNGGTISGSGAFTVSGTLSIDTATSKLLNGRTLVSNGTGEWVGSGTVNLAGGAVLRNGAGATFDIKSAGFMGVSGSPSGETFDNDGTLLKSGAGVSTLDVIVDTSGTVSVGNGTLATSRAGTWGGQLTVASGAVARFNGGTHGLSGLTIGGMGRVELSGGTVNTTGAVTVDAAATLALTATLGGAGPLTVNGRFEWTAGTLTGAGACTINGPFILDSGSGKTLNGRTLVSNGAAEWRSSGPVSLANGAVLRNSATGTFDIKGAGFMGVSGTPAGETFDNDGLLMKTGAGTSTLDVIVDATGGPITVGSGTLALSRTSTWSGQLTVASGAVVRFAGGTHALSGLTIGGMGRVEIGGGTVNTTGAVTVTVATTLALTATLGGAGPLTVDGRFEWTAGTLTGGGACTINGPLILDSGSGKTLNGRTLVSNGAAEWRGSGPVSLANGAVLRNSATGTFDIQGAAFMGVSGTPAGETFDNDGTLMKTSVGTTTLDVIVDATSGPISVLSGTLGLSRTSTWSGTAPVGAGAVVRFTGGTHSLTGLTFAGMGRVELVGGTVNTSGAVTVESGIVMALTAMLGGAGPLTVNGRFEWTAGSTTGSGPFTVNGTLILDSGSGKTLNGRTLVSNGAAEWRGTGTVNLANGAVLRNGASGTFDIQGAAFMGISGTPSTETFDNHGIVTKTSAGTTTLDVFVTNAGAVEIKAGTLASSRAAYLQTAGSTTLNGGNLTALVGAGVNLMGGALAGFGTVTGSVANGGVVRPGLSPGKLTITNNYTQTAGGAFNVELGGLAPGTTFDQLQVNGTATLNGTLNVALINGFTPAAGNQFLVLNGTTGGGFSVTNLPPLPGGLSWHVIVGSVLLEVDGGGPSPTPTQSPAATQTRTRTASATPTNVTGTVPASTATPTRTATATPALSSTSTATATPALSPTSTATATPVVPSRTPTVTATPTPVVASATPTTTGTQTASASATVSATATGTATSSASSTATRTRTITPSPSPTITGGSDSFELVGSVLGPGPAGNMLPFGLGPAAGQPVDFITCAMPSVCLASPPPLMTVDTDERGRFRFRVPRSVVRQGLFVLIQAVVGGTRCRIALTPTQVAILAGAAGARGAADTSGVGGDEITIDPIVEAASRLLEAAGADDFTDEGIAAVQAAVLAANADSRFDGLTVVEANDQAEATAAADPGVQTALEAGKRTPTPTSGPSCIGDCNASGTVTVDELVRGVNIALGSASIEVCPQFDADASQTVTINEIVNAVVRALTGC